MSFPIRRRSAFVVTAFALITVGLAACTDSRISALTVGISKDSALKVIGKGAPEGDSLRNIYRRVQFFTDSRLFDIYLFDAKDRKAWKDSTVADKDLVPVVMVGDKLEGYGWRYMDDLTTKYKLNVRRQAK